MNIKQLTEQHLEFLSLIWATQDRVSLHLSKCHIVGNHIITQNVSYYAQHHVTYAPAKFKILGADTITRNVTEGAWMDGQTKV